MAMRRRFRPFLTGRADIVACEVHDRFRPDFMSHNPYNRKYEKKECTGWVKLFHFMQRKNIEI